jgi:hypothetical protein
VAHRGCHLDKAGVVMLRKARHWGYNANAHCLFSVPVNSRCRGDHIPSSFSVYFCDDIVELVVVLNMKQPFTAGH